ncbi:hypothetical protein [Streptomyces sp. NRRL S-118]|uniref:hypothetical protein n=1 Tax=Streptomyces sp. NRRL S-118 TaxID=1463881 RepID=UPI00069357DE|nr:hypothetical protein [Streptomyces sp. NRRL S-118]
MTKAPQQEWAELAKLVRKYQQVADSPVIRPLGRYYDVVITAAGDVGERLLQLMDTVQPGGCGPVIAEDGRPWLYWLVPPGTIRIWYSRYAACLSAPMKIPFPPVHHDRPPGPYWLRPFRADVRVGPGLLHDALNAIQPQLTPYDALGELLGLGRDEPPVPQR